MFNCDIRCLEEIRMKIVDSQMYLPKPVATTLLLGGKRLKGGGGLDALPAVGSNLKKVSTNYFTRLPIDLMETCYLSLVS